MQMPIARACPLKLDCIYQKNIAAHVVFDEQSSHGCTKVKREMN